MMEEKDKKGLKALSMNKGTVAIQSAYLMYLLPRPHPPITSSTPLCTKLADGLMNSADYRRRVGFHGLTGEAYLSRAGFRPYNANGGTTIGLLPSRVGRWEEVNREAD